MSEPKLRLHSLDALRGIAALAVVFWHWQHFQLLGTSKLTWPPVSGGVDHARDPGVETFAGALIRRGEAVGEVVATGARTKFGRSAELIRTTHVESTEQKAIFRVVRNLALFNTKQCLGVGPTCLGARLASASREQFRACSLDKANGLTADGVMLQRQAWASPSL